MFIPMKLVPQGFRRRRADHDYPDRAGLQESYTLVVHIDTAAEMSACLRYGLMPPSMTIPGSSVISPACANIARYFYYPSITQCQYTCYSFARGASVFPRCTNPANPGRASTSSIVLLSPLYELAVARGKEHNRRTESASPPATRYP